MKRLSNNIRIKRAYEVPQATDGKRILIDRLWPRGLSKDNAHIAEWLKDIAPSAELRKWFNHEPEHFREFSRRYRKELETHIDLLNYLAKIATCNVLTLIYAAHNEKYNHAKVLADYLTKYTSK